MALSSEALDAVLVVGLPSEEEQLARIVTILRGLGIAADIAAPGTVGEADAVAVRVPGERIVAAALALEQHGFTRLKAYGAR
jgi:hypothetical protein